MHSRIRPRPQNGTMAFILHRDPEAKNIQIEQTAEVYGPIPDFRRVLNDYYSDLIALGPTRKERCRSSRSTYGAMCTCKCAYCKITIWFILPRLRLHFLPATKSLMGHCNFVLVKDSSGASMPVGIRSRTIGIRGSLLIIINVVYVLICQRIPPMKDIL